jgi:GDP-4-dehydro-6-deoxy-D-mannose reductase
MSKKVLITGCSGFLAMHLVGVLERAGAKPVITGITEEKDFRSSRFEAFHVDLRDRDRVFEAIEEIKPELVFHFAAIANVGFSWRHQKETYEVNFIGSSNLLEALAKVAPQCRVVMMSTAELYGNTKETPYSENDPLCPPRNPYALSKRAMEMVADLYIHSKQMDIIKIRAFNFTGPGQDRKFVASDFSYQVAAIEKGVREPVIKVGNLSAVRDISDVRDVARYLHVIAQQGESGGVYNTCSGKTFSIKEILAKLLSLSGKEIDVSVDPDKLRPVDVPVLWGNNSKIKESFGLEPQYDIGQTLTDLLNFWRRNIEE